jgi:hypothetical protein
VKRLATKKLLGDLAFELNAVGSMSRHRLFSKSPVPRSIHSGLPVRLQGPTPRYGVKVRPIDMLACNRRTPEHHFSAASAAAIFGSDWTADNSKA